jgi:hypothetical protein
MNKIKGLSANISKDIYDSIAFCIFLKKQNKSKCEISLLGKYEKCVSKYEEKQVTGENIAGLWDFLAF